MATTARGRCVLRADLTPKRTGYAFIFAPTVGNRTDRISEAADHSDVHPEPTLHPNDILLWADGFWCFRIEYRPEFLRDDSYRVVSPDCAEWSSYAD
jgi:hypothetical protein